MLAEFVRAFAKRQQEAIDGLAKRMLSGQCADWADYQNKVGEARGRQKALESVTEIAQDLMKEETLDG